MGRIEEPLTKLERLVEIGAKKWSLASFVFLQLAGALLKELDWPMRGLVLSLSISWTFAGWIWLRNLSLERRQKILLDELDVAYRSPDEPVLTEPQNVMVCLAWDYYPWGLEDRDFVKDFPMDDDDLEDALNLLVKWDYLECQDGRGPVGESNDPDTYMITKKGRRYVEANWPNRGDARRQKIHRAIRRRLKAGR